ATRTGLPALSLPIILASPRRLAPRRLAPCDRGSACFHHQSAKDRNGTPSSSWRTVKDGFAAKVAFPPNPAIRARYCEGRLRGTTGRMREARRTAPLGR